MYSKPYVVGIDSLLAQAKTDAPESMIQLLGYNSGNLVFSEALYRCLDGAHRGNFGFLERDLDGHDCIVIAAANWLNSYEDFGWALQKLEKTTLPIVIVGLGAQSHSASSIPELKPNTRRMIEVISERSALISVRGQFSAEVLDHYGIRNSMLTGCPSLLLFGSDGPKIRGLEDTSIEGCAINSTRHMMQNANELQSYFYRQAIKHDIDIILQSETADYYLMHYEKKLNEDNLKMLRDVYAVGDIEVLKSYLQEHAKLFLSLEDWMAFAARSKFSFGTRIHGAVVSLLAGTPATLITHDERTMELARSMSIPHMAASEVDLTRDVSVEDFYSREKIRQFEDGYKYYRSKFDLFFKLNGLSLSNVSVSSAP